LELALVYNPLHQLDRAGLIAIASEDAMRAMVLAAGLGTRLLPLTRLRPKCLMPVMNQPLLGLWLQRLEALGAQGAVVNTHHLAPLVAGYLAGRPAGGLAVVQSHEPVILGTGGGLVAARRLLGERPFLLVNSDVLASADPRPLLKALEASGALAVLGLSDQPRFNTVALDRGGRVLGFKGHGGHGGLAEAPRWLTYSGLAAISPALLDFLPAQGFSTLVQGLEAGLAAGGQVLGWELGGFWDDLGTPEHLLDLHRLLLEAPPAGLEHLAPREPLVLAPGAVVEPGARVEGLAVLGAGARLETGSLVKNSLLLPGARVAAGARVRDAVLGDGFLARGEIIGGAHA
jgi:mannose-1-phosphate guanylyltransferase